MHKSDWLVRWIFLFVVRQNNILQWLTAMRENPIWSLIIESVFILNALSLLIETRKEMNAKCDRFFLFLFRSNNVIGNLLAGVFRFTYEWSSRLTWKRFRYSIEFPFTSTFDAHNALIYCTLKIVIWWKIVAVITRHTLISLGSLRIQF